MNLTISKNSNNF